MPTDSPPSADTLPALAQRVRELFSLCPFGGLWFWQFAVVRPHDEGQQVLDCQAQGRGDDARLVFTLQHASGQGHTALLEVWGAAGLSVDAQGLRLQHARQLRFGNAQAQAENDGYSLTTPRGTGHFAQGGAPALFLQR